MQESHPAAGGIGGAFSSAEKTRMQRRAAVGVLPCGVLAIVLAACGSNGKTPAASSTAQATGNKTTFCNADVTLDKASGTVTSSAGFLAVLKANPAALAAMKNDAPTGKVGTEAKAMVNAADQAVATNNVNLLNSMSNNGADIDTYCGVDGSGDRLPSYFGQGKATAFCSVADQINNGTNNAGSAQGAFTFLAAHQSLINQYASDLSTLPANIKSAAQYLVNTARSAIAANSATALGTSTVQDDSMETQLYCGQNQ